MTAAAFADLMAMGGSMVKYIEKVQWYIKTIIFLVKRLEVVVRCCLGETFFLAISFIVVLGNIYKISSKFITKSIAQKVMAIHDLKTTILSYILFLRILLKTLLIDMSQENS